MGVEPQRRRPGCALGPSQHGTRRDSLSAASRRKLGTMTIARALQFDEVERALGVQPFYHPLVGDLTLNYDVLDLPASWTSTPGEAPSVASGPDT
jgi:hypothetical protein